MATHAEIRSFVRLQTLAETDDLSDADLTVYINEGYNDLVGKFRWPFLEASVDITTVEDQAAYALPATHRRTVAIADEDGKRRLTRISLVDAVDRWGNDFPTGDEARWFYVWGESVYLVPIPETASIKYKHHYIKAPTLLVGTDTVPEFAAEFHLATLGNYAIARVWEREEDLQKSERYMQRYDRAVEDMARYYITRVEHTPLIYGEQPSESRWIRYNMPFLDGGL